MNESEAEKPHILHLHSTFSAGGKELRCAQLINAFGDAARHSIVSAMPERMEAAAAIKRGASVQYPKDFPPLAGRPTLGRLNRLARAMQPFDLVLTYNWGAMDAVMAHTVFSQALTLPPLVHHEDGFNEDERVKLKWTRNLYRRIALGRADRLVVPSQLLEQIATKAWQQPRSRVTRIPNGVNVDAFARRAKPDAMRGLVKRKGELWVGTMAGLREVKNLPRLVRAFASLPDPWQLVIFGEGPERDTIRQQAEAINVAHRLHMPGFAADPSKVMGLLDIFALSSDSEQAPISVIEAMASGIPVVAPAVGDVASMVAQSNVPFIVRPGSDPALQSALLRMAEDASQRAEIGEENRQKARREFDEGRMIEAYRRIYGDAMGRTI